MQVLKFGGTSVASAEIISKVKNIVSQKAASSRLVAVVSAVSGVTDKLLHCGLLAVDNNKSYSDIIEHLTQQHIEIVRQLLPVTAQSSLLSWVVQQLHEIEDLCNGISLLHEFPPRIRAKLLSYGELLSSTIIAKYFTEEGLPAQWIDARSCIRTDSDYLRATVDFSVTTIHLQREVMASTANVFVIPGFIGSDEKGNVTTLGRGGSDYTAAIAGNCLDASVVEIWTDVSGMMTADPRLVSNARPISSISCNEAMELSHFGARVIYPPTLQPLMSKAIPIHIKNTFAVHDEGTVIESGLSTHSRNICGISSISEIALLSLEGSGMVGIPGFSKKLFEALALAQINVIFITQASSEHSICVGIEEKYSAEAKQVVDKAFDYEIQQNLLNPLLIEKDLAIVALIGDSMKSHQGISGRMFGALGRNGINVRGIAQGSSERNISAVLDGRDVRKALNVLHEEFFEKTPRQINLFIVGTGNVGGKLLTLLAQQQGYLKTHLNVIVNVIGLANSRKMVLADQAIGLTEWTTVLDSGEAMDLNNFVGRMMKKNLGNTVFVDVTANEQVAKVYETVFAKSVSVVACNKIAASGEYVDYKKLKDRSQEFNASFLFETNVGAGLPIIGTLNDLIRSGDRIQRIEAVLSGTLNYVFNHYNGEQPFSEVVRQAQKEGYTEPDPRLDLSGTDVMRKILILARESGAELEMNGVHNESFLPASCMNGSVEDFYEEMKKEEGHFKSLYSEAAAKGMKLKFVAAYNNGKASVGLRHIDPGHNFFHLYGKDNVVSFYTSRYPDQPLVIKGAGAGAEVTASGVFADILRTVNSK